MCVLFCGTVSEKYRFKRFEVTLIFSPSLTVGSFSGKKLECPCVRSVFTAKLHVYILQPMRGSSNSNMRDQSTDTALEYLTVTEQEGT